MAPLLPNRFLTQPQRIILLHEGMFEVGPEDMVPVLDLLQRGVEFPLQFLGDADAEDFADLVRGQPPQPTAIRLGRLFARWLPRPRVVHPYPVQRFAATHPRSEPYAVIPLVRIRAGGARQLASLTRPFICHPGDLSDFFTAFKEAPRKPSITVD